MANFPSKAVISHQDVAVSFDPDAFDFAVQNHGVTLTHYAALRCPVGMTDLDDNRRPHEDHAGCSGGFLYHQVGDVKALLTSQGNSPQLKDIGFIDGASFNATFPRYYVPEDDKCPPTDFYVAPFDRFYLKEASIMVPTWQLLITSGGNTDRLNFPAIKVERLVDSRGDMYTQGTDFTVNSNGHIAWTASGRRPSSNLDTGRGAVISVRYWYRPFWYCSRLMHEIRVAQIESQNANDRQIMRMPQAALLQREFLFLNESQDNMAADPRSIRQTTAPESGGFGPR